MIDALVKAWAENKQHLETKLRLTEQKNYWEYKDLVRMTVDIVINSYLIGNEGGRIQNGFDSEQITEVDDGDFMGTKLFLIPLAVGYPEVYDYICIDVGYGSCCVCDTLQRIRDDVNGTETGCPNEGQIKQYMHLCMHMIQRAFWLKGEKA